MPLQLVVIYLIFENVFILSGLLGLCPPKRRVVRRRNLARRHVPTICRTCWVLSLQK